MPEPLLCVRDLVVHFHPSRTRVLDRISFDVATGETVGVLGESGTGKTTLARALVGLLSDCWDVSGTVRFRGVEMLRANARQLQKMRGAQISSIFQEPELALNPVLCIGRQVEEVFRAHAARRQGSAREQAKSMLASVGLSDPRLYSAYPHELSGGQRQRVVIAQSLVAQPSLLIADEPTSALDNVVQADVLHLLRTLKDRLQLALLFITHDPALLTGLADRVMVMHTGRIVETGTLAEICQAPRHPYTRLVMEAMCNIVAV